MFADDICLFSPRISGLQCLLHICGYYTAEHKLAFNCNKTIGVISAPKIIKNHVPSNVFLNGVCVQFFEQVKYLGVLLNSTLKDDDGIQRQVKVISLYYAANKFRGTFDHCFPTVQNTLYRA